MLGRLTERVGLPPLLGMIGGGVLVANLYCSPGELQLTKIAGPVRLGVLALVLLRAGLGISRQELREAGRWAVLLGTLPMCCDAAAVAAASHWLLDLSWSASAVLGFLVAAISPAIVIPGLLTLLERLTGSQRRVPAALLAGAPLDNICALIGLGVALNLSTGQEVEIGPTALLALAEHGGGVIAGVIAAILLVPILSRVSPRNSGLILWGVACGLIAGGLAVGFDFVLAIIALGFVVRTRAPGSAEAMAEQLCDFWSLAQYALFGAIGAAVDLAPLARVGLAATVTIGLGQLARAGGALAVTSTGEFSWRERLGCVASYVPKATIQAAFAGLALDRGMPEGSLIMSVGVLAIVITAPIGIVALGHGAARLFGAQQTPE